MPTPKNDHWQDIVLTPTGVAPGTYNPASITVDATGRVTGASNSSIAAVSTVSLIAGLPTIIGPANGSLAVVLDDGTGNEELYVWNNSNPDLGAPLTRWRLIAATDINAPRTDYRQSAIDTTALQFIGAAIPLPGIVKSVTVEITVPYSIGASIEIQNDNALTTFMPSTDINPQLAGIYKIDLSGNLDDILTGGGVSGQIRAIISGAPGVGAGVVFVEWVNV